VDSRRVAFEILLRVETAGAFASVLLEHRESELRDPRDARLAHHMVLGVLRSRASLDHVLERVASRPVRSMDPPVRTALRIGAFALLHLDRVPDFAAVDSAVDLVKRSRARRSASFVNGVLRKVAGARSDLLPREPAPGDIEGLATYRSHPEWWVRRVVDRLGWQAADRLLEANNQPAPTVFRPNLNRIDGEALCERLAAEQVTSERCRFVPDAFRVLSGAPRRSLAFAEGLAWVQDEAAQLVPLLFDGRLGRAIDLCAAPGGKSFQMTERLSPGIPLIAVDRHPGRLRRMAGLAARLGKRDILTVAADMAADGTALRGEFDSVLLDAPCSGSGTMRRHPEIRWRLQLSDLERLASRQRALLETAASLVAPGGTLVYSVCSLEPEEGEQGICRFLSDHTEFQLEDPGPRLPEECRELVRAPGFLHTSPVDEGLDGFFAAVLRRRG